MIEYPTNNDKNDLTADEIIELDSLVRPTNINKEKWKEAQLELEKEK